MKLKQCSKCGKTTKLWKANPPLCKYCSSGGVKIAKITEKKKDFIKMSKAYYSLAITKNKLSNGGKCICEECGNEIKSPSGRNVSHIISGGSNIALYLEPTNNFILCAKCENIWTNISPSSMKIWGEAQERKEKLNLKYYGG